MPWCPISVAGSCAALCSRRSGTLASASRLRCGRWRQSLRATASVSRWGRSAPSCLRRWHHRTRTRLPSSAPQSLRDSSCERQPREEGGGAGGKQAFILHVSRRFWADGLNPGRAGRAVRRSAAWTRAGLPCGQTQRSGSAHPPAPFVFCRQVENAKGAGFGSCVGMTIGEYETGIPQRSPHRDGLVACLLVALVRVLADRGGMCVLWHHRVGEAVLGLRQLRGPQEELEGHLGFSAGTQRLRCDACPCWREGISGASSTAEGAPRLANASVRCNHGPRQVRRGRGVPRHPT